MIYTFNTTILPSINKPPISFPTPTKSIERAKVDKQENPAVRYHHHPSMVKSSSSRLLHTPNSSIPLPNTAAATTTTTNLHPKAESTRKRQYKGVRMRSWGSWVSEIRAPHQKTRIWLGSYSTPEAAARAYDAALLCLKGSSAALNFPTSLPCHPPDTTMSPKSIQRVAAAAANAATPATSTLCPAITPSPSPLSPSSPSSPSDTTECSPSTTTTTTTSSSSCMVSTIEEASWIDFGAFQSPIFVDQIINPSIAPWEDLDEEGDFKLWSFC